MIEKAKALVMEYINAHTERSGTETEPEMFVVWQARVLENFKCLICAPVMRWTYFEITYDGRRESWYIDVYRKVENLEIEDGIHQ